MKTLFLLCALFTVVSLRTYSKCELARVFQNNGLDGIPGSSLADWVCLVQYASGFRTDAVGQNKKDGQVVSTNYGLFQFNSRWWCDDGKTKYSHNGCKRRCTRKMSEFTDNDITDDITCAKRVLRDPNGMDAWYGWKNNCKGNVLDYLKECNL